MLCLRATTIIKMHVKNAAALSVASASQERSSQCLGPREHCNFSQGPFFLHVLPLRTAMDHFFTRYSTVSLLISCKISSFYQLHYMQLSVNSTCVHSSLARQTNYSVNHAKGATRLIFAIVKTLHMFRLCDVIFRDKSKTKMKLHTINFWVVALEPSALKSQNIRTN